MNMNDYIDGAIEFPKLTEEQFKIFKEQVKVKVEVNTWERVTIKSNGDLFYGSIPDGEITGWIDGKIFGICIYTNQIKHQDLIVRAAELFIENNFDVVNTRKAIEEEYIEHI